MASVETTSFSAQDATDTAVVTPAEAAIDQALRRLDAAGLARQFIDDDGLLLLPDLLPPAYVTEMAAEALSLAPDARRAYVPFVRRAGDLDHHDIQDRAPALAALHSSPALLAFFQCITGTELQHRLPDDPRASSLYVYNQPGDEARWHYDDPGSVPGTSFSAVVALVDKSSARLEFELHRKTPGRTPVLRSTFTRPGTLAFFRSSSVYHRVTPLRAGEERITFSFAYVKKGHQPRGLDRVRRTAIDSLLYFGRKGQKPR